MLDFLTNFFQSIFGDNSILATIIVAMVPLIELKGAIPFGMSENFWGVNALSPIQAFLYALLGSCIVVPILALIFKPIYEHIKDKKFFKKIVNFFVGDIKTKSEKVDNNLENKSKIKMLWIKIITVVLFVAFPVPLTGVWTGTCLAVFLGLNFWQTLISVFVGNAICGLIVAFICSMFPEATTIILIIFVSLIVLALIVKIIMHIGAKKKGENYENKQ